MGIVHDARPVYHSGLKPTKRIATEYKSTMEKHPVNTNNLNDDDDAGIDSHHRYEYHP